MTVLDGQSVCRTVVPAVTDGEGNTVARVAALSLEWKDLDCVHVIVSRVVRDDKEV